MLTSYLLVKYQKEFYTSVSECQTAGESVWQIFTDIVCLQPIEPQWIRSMTELRFNLFGHWTNQLCSIYNRSLAYQNNCIFSFNHKNTAFINYCILFYGGREHSARCTNVHILSADHIAKKKKTSESNRISVTEWIESGIYDFKKKIY